MFVFFNISQKIIYLYISLNEHFEENGSGKMYF